MKNGFVLIVFLFFIHLVRAQECSSIEVKGSVIDTSKAQSFYNVVIVNRSTGVGIFGSPDGTFEFKAKEGDKITLSVTGYKMSSFIVESYNCKQFKTIVLSLVTYQSRDVIVKPLKSLEDIKKERQELALKETRTVKGINVAISPITALYERFSKIGKSKTLAAKLEHQDDINNVLKELLRLYVSYDVVDLDEAEFVDFIQFLNISENFLKSASDYQLILFIKDKLEHYKSLNDYYYQKKDN
jgi:hypothetical protein